METEFHLLREGNDHLVMADLERQLLPLFRFIQKLIKTPSAVVPVLHE